MERGLTLAWQTVIKMIDGFFRLLPNLVIAGVILFVFYFLSRIVGKAAYSLSSRAQIDKTLAHAIAKLMSVATVVMGILICAVIVVPNFSPDKLIAGLGITSVAIGFAFQNILQNFFAGMLLLWQKPFGIGDEIKAKDFEGTVQDITIRTTLLKTHTGELVYIPNGVLFTEPVTVFTAYDKRRIHLQIPFANISEDKAIEVAKTALNGLSAVAKDPKPQVYTAVSGGSLALDVFFWASSANAKMIQATDEAATAIGRALKEQERIEKDRKDKEKAA